MSRPNLAAVDRRGQAGSGLAFLCFAAKKLAHAMGGIDKARAALDALAKLL